MGHRNFTFFFWTLHVAFKLNDENRAGKNLHESDKDLKETTKQNRHLGSLCYPENLNVVSTGKDKEKGFKWKTDVMVQNRLTKEMLFCSQAQGRTKIWGRPGQTNKLAPLKPIFFTFSCQGQDLRIF